MGFIRQRQGLRRVLAVPAAKLGAAVSTGILALCLFAGAVRVLPLLVGSAGPGLPLRALGPLARGVLGMSLETALVIAPPLAWALASAKLVERGEARALFAVGVRPVRIVASAWPAVLLVALAAGLSAALWGREAAAPGRLVRALVADVRAACASNSAVEIPQGVEPLDRDAPLPVAMDIPTLGLAWVCFPGEAPRVVGPAPIGRGGAALSATGVHLSDDLRALDLDGVALVLPVSSEVGALSGARLRVGRASIRGLAPLGRASNLSVVARALLMALSSLAMASLAAFTVLARSVKSRAAALAVGLAGPAAALMVFATLERSPVPPLVYVAVPLSGLAAVGAASWIVQIVGARRG